jgi:hypothetical protein
MSHLLELALNAHGGVARWQQIRTLDFRVAVEGALYSLKGFPEGLPSAAMHVEAHRPAVTLMPYLMPGARGHFAPDRVWIEDADGKVVDSRVSPRASFAGHTLRTQWDQLQRLYFAGYSLWNHLTAPFLIAEGGGVTHELEPHRENGHTWRRLQVTFPQEIPTHSAEQTFYFSDAGVLQRIDYVIDIAGVAVAHYCYDHALVAGILFATSHRVVRRTNGGPQLSGTGVLLQLQLSNFFVS